MGIPNKNSNAAISRVTHLVVVLVVVVVVVVVDVMGVAVVEFAVVDASRLLLPVVLPTAVESGPAMIVLPATGAAT